MALLGLLGLLALAAGVGYAQVGSGLDLSWNTIDGGGGASGAGGGYGLAGTIGQPDAGAMTGGTYGVVGGFWGAGLNAAPLVGRVAWQGPPLNDPRSQLPITLTLCAGGAALDFAATTDASGLFTVTTGLASGTYNWRAKGLRYLATSGTLQLAVGTLPESEVKGANVPTTLVEMGLQRAGDVNSTHDNLVNILDFNVLKLVFGTTDPAADLNNDGLTNVVDFNLLKSNFGTAGAPLACP